MARKEKKNKKKAATIRPIWLCKLCRVVIAVGVGRTNFSSRLEIAVVLVILLRDYVLIGNHV